MQPPHAETATFDAEGALHPNHKYAVDTALRMVGQGARILDYGCGAGETVVYGRQTGLDMVGADVFYAGARSREIAEANGLLGNVVFHMADGRLPFSDDSFDMVCSNFVFEHVEDMDQALFEVRRVLKPGGIFLNLFPTLGVLREGHCGVPLAHLFTRSPSIQRPYLLAWRILGFGYHKRGKGRREWASDFSAWLGAYTHYRSKRTVFRHYRRWFDKVERLEADFLAYRLEARGMLKTARLARLPLLSWAGKAIAYRLAATVLLGR